MKFIYTIIIIALLGFTSLSYMGALDNYQIVEKEMGPYTIAYKEFVGPYSQTNATMQEVYQALQDDGIDTKIGIGIYLDNPAVTDKEDLRSEVGSIIEEQDISKLNQTGEKYMVKTIPKEKSVVAEFPYKNSISYILGPIKIYSAMEKYMDEKNITWTEDMPAIEIYDLEKGFITYAVNLSIASTTSNIETISGDKKENNEKNITTEESDTIPQSVITLAQSSKECTEAGVLGEDNWYNTNSKTWWIDLVRTAEEEKDGCNPACVINTETNEVDVNWMCTGLVTPPVAE